jgi:hypothetical protein
MIGEALRAANLRFQPLTRGLSRVRSSLTGGWLADRSTHPREPFVPTRVVRAHWRFVMRVFLGMILGALLLVAGVYTYDSMQTSMVANGQVAQTNPTIVNWEVAANDWHALKTRAHDDWIRLSSK